MSKPFGVMSHLSVTMCEDAQDAVAKGFNYEAPEFTAVSVEKVVVVKRGTVNNNSTVDFVLVDETGKKYVFMVTGHLLKSIPC